MLRRIAVKEFVEASRDGQVRIVVVATLILFIVALSLAAHRYSESAEVRSLAQEMVNEQWEGQTEKIPHLAAHFGALAYKEVTVLSLFDPGVNQYAGNAIWLEAHNRKDAHDAPASDLSSAERLGELNVATVLLLAVPLLIIVLAHGAFARERELGTLRLVVASGVRPISLFGGKLIGLSLLLSRVLVPTAILGAIVLWWQDQSYALLIQYGLLIVGYGLYYAVFLFLALAVSAISRSASAALISLFSIWMLIAFVVPRVSATVSEHVYPTPSYYDLRQAIESEMALDPNGLMFHPELANALMSAMREHGVTTVEELNNYVDATAIIVYNWEMIGQRVHDSNFARLASIYRKQAALRNAFGIISPFIAAQSVSATLSQTSLEDHLTWADDAEQYRQHFVNTLNEDILENAAAAGGYMNYVGDPALWNKIHPYEPVRRELRLSVKDTLLPIAVLLGWIAAMVIFATACVRRLSPIGGR